MAGDKEVMLIKAYLFSINWGLPIILNTIGIIFAFAIGVIGLACAKQIIEDFGGES